MTPLSRITSRLWIVVLAAALGCIALVDLARARRVDFLNNVVPVELAVDPASPTGYTHGLRRFIVPEHNNESYQWIAQTQQMLAERTWRLRHIGYDNAPTGREVTSPSPYRWWLGFMAMLVRLFSSAPAGIAVERAALLADPLLHLLLVASATVYAARRFGAGAAAAMAVGLATFFPYGGTFLPGQPGDESLAQFALLWSVLPLLAGIRSATEAGSSRRVSFDFILAAAAGGFGLWLNPARATPAIAALALGGLLAAWWLRRTPHAAVFASAWRQWALAGALATFAAYLVEFFPDRLDDSLLRLQVVHPLYAVAWLGLGELIGTATRPPGASSSAARTGAIVRAVLGAAAVAALVFACGRIEGGVFASDVAASGRLTALAGSPAGSDTLAWLVHDGLDARALATLAPLAGLLLAAGVLLARRAHAETVALLLVGLLPALVACGFAWFQLRWWNACDGLVAALLVAAISAATGLRWARLATVVALSLAAIPGIGALRPATGAARETVDAADVIAFLERDLAHWLASRQSGGAPAVVLAPPNVTVSLYFHGGLAGLGTPYWENRAGFNAAVRLAGASSPDEARLIAQSRNVRYLVLPSWDDYLDEYARLGANQPEHTLVALLHRWLPPRWLRPVPYRAPEIPGFDPQSVVVFEVVDTQENATALSHLAEYFIEMGQPEQAVLVARSLERSFPDDLGATIARTEVAQASGNAAGSARLAKDLRAMIEQGDAEFLPWDRRAGLALVLAGARDLDAAREQAKRCLAEADEDRLRLLSPPTLYRFLKLTKALNLLWNDPAQRDRARALLPAEMREQL